MPLFPVPSLSEFRDTVVAVFRSFFPDRNIASKRSVHGRRASVLAAVGTTLHRHVDSVGKEVLPTTAPDGGPIQEWGKPYSVVPKGATGARKAAALRIYGIAAATIDDGEELVHPESQLRFRTVGAYVIPGVAPFYVDADVEATSTGSATRLTKDSTLEFLVTPANIETQATLVKDLDEDGTDAEQFGPYRQRVLDAMGKPPSGGNQADFEAWALAIPGISKARVYENRAGLGTTDVAVLHSGTGAARIPSVGTRAAVLAYLKGKAPGQIGGTGGGLRVLTVIADPQPIEIQIQARTDAAYRFDWTGSMTVSAYNAGTLEVTVTGGVLPDSLFAGARFVVKGVASAQLGEEMVIKAITAVDKFVLQDIPAVNLAATDVIYSGGPLVTPIRNAILAHLDGEAVFGARGGVPKGEGQLALEDQSIVGLEVIAEGIDTANPGGAFGSWTGGIVTDVIRQIAMAKTGVRKTNLVTPAADYEATDYAFPLDAQIGLVTRAAVLVREL